MRTAVQILADAEGCQEHTVQYLLSVKKGSIDYRLAVKAVLAAREQALQEVSDWATHKMSLAPDDMVPSERGLYDGYLNTVNQIESLLKENK
jgi:hypothetical protein